MIDIVKAYNDGQKEWFVDLVFNNKFCAYHIKSDYKKGNESRYDFSNEISLETFIADFENVYKLIETISKNKDVRGDFLRSIKKKNEVWQNIQYKKTIIYLFFQDDTDSHGGLVRITNEKGVIENQAKQMLANYWQSYIIKQIKGVV